LGDPHWEVRAQASQALGELCDAGVIAALFTALKDGHWSVRNHAAKAIVQIVDHARA
jgi:HEAT repeat protein